MEKIYIATRCAIEEGRNEVHVFADEIEWLKLLLKWQNETGEVPRYDSIAHYYIHHPNFEAKRIDL